MLRPALSARIATGRGSSRTRRAATSAIRLLGWPDDVRQAWLDIANVTTLKKGDRITLELASRLLAQTRSGEPVTPSLANQLLAALRMLGLSGGGGSVINGSGDYGLSETDRKIVDKYFR